MEQRADAIAGHPRMTFTTTISSGTKGTARRLLRLAIQAIEQPVRYIGRRAALSLLLPAVACVVLAWLIIGRLGPPAPRIEDEFSYLLAGETFVSGRMANPTHPQWIYFETPHVLQRPTYVSVYPPAQGIALAAGQVVAGHPWYGVLASVALMCAAVSWALRAWVPSGWALVGGLISVQIGVFGSAHSTGYWANSEGYWTASYWGGAVAAIGGALVLGVLGRLRQRGEFVKPCSWRLGSASSRTADLMRAWCTVLGLPPSYSGLSCAGVLHGVCGCVVSFYLPEE